MQWLVARSRCISGNGIGYRRANQCWNNERVSTSGFCDKYHSSQWCFITSRDERGHAYCCIETDGRAMNNRLGEGCSQSPSSKKQGDEHGTHSPRRKRGNSGSQLEPAEGEELSVPMVSGKNCSNRLIVGTDRYQRARINVKEQKSAQPREQAADGQLYPVRYRPFHKKSAGAAERDDECHRYASDDQSKQRTPI